MTRLTIGVLNYPHATTDEARVSGLTTQMADTWKHLTGSFQNLQALPISGIVFECVEL